MKSILRLFIPGIAVLATVFLIHKKKSFTTFSQDQVDENENEERMRFQQERVKYEFDMLKDPVTGKIPIGVFEREIALARTLPVKDIGNATFRTTVLNTYIPAGPNNIGGRTRALAYDVRYNGSTNQVILSGCISGGIMRSADGGSSWTRVSPVNDIHNISSLVQDPRAGFQDTWYAGGGEPIGNTAAEIGAFYFGQYIWKSTNNGLSWTRLILTFNDIAGNSPSGTELEAFDHPFDMVHRLALNPVNGNLYIACHRRLIRSLDGGNTFQTVFGSTVGANTSNGQTDIAVTNTGKCIIAVNGGNPDHNLRGVWTSATGALGSWTRIAGGSTLGVDSIAGWRANSPSNDSKRILVTIAPSNQNIAYVCYENGLSNESPDLKPEADMYKLDMTGGTNVWTNLSANMPDFPGSNVATDPFEVQAGYDLFVTVKPNDPNFVILGGASLYRSTDGFSTTANTSWIGGYGNTLPSLSIYPNSHPDIHNFVFNPSNFNEALCSNDGGVQLTTNITASGSGVTWSMVSNYQTLQYYSVGVDPETGQNNFVGGAQDNGTQFRDKTGILGTAASDSNNHRRILSGDGSSACIGNIIGSNQFAYCGFQFGNIRRFLLESNPPSTDIRPAGLTPDPESPNDFGEFVTIFQLDPDNTEDLYYVNFNRLFRSTNASTVTSSSWTELTGVGSTVDPDGATNEFNSIRALSFSRGPYTTSHVLYLGTTQGKIFRLDDPRNAAITKIPVEITPAGLTGNVQDIATNPNNDDEIIVVVTNYNTTNIWWTKNGKATSPTWFNAEGNLTLPSMRSCEIIVKKDASNNPVTEYYVGTSIGLYSVENLGTILTGGGTPAWQREGGNILNFAVVQSMSYRPEDNLLLIGTHGNGMYYTFSGTPNFTPNQNTGVDPVVNDKIFIKIVFPSITINNLFYKTGKLLGVKTINIKLFNASGQEVKELTANYQDGTLNLANLANGVYILSITSDNRKYRYIQKLVKQ